MKPGDLVRIRKFEDVMIGVYLGPSRRFDPSRRVYEGRFSVGGIIYDIDLGNRLVWGLEVISETG